ncbi:snRNA-activating protein complex subunit 5-like [Euwallacea fornicatus]|uniref:snRNA-activating protein complex subunit 5-like n=1 Tax=Euwallacea fornicatus TaxID=995702 RepID=UPI00338F2741
MTSTTFKSSNPDLEHLKKLKLTEQGLAAMLHKIDTEITQTDLEWMHLQSLVTQTNGHSSNSKANKAVETKTKVQRSIDDESVNQIQLDLSLPPAGLAQSSEEEEEEEELESD